MKTILVAFITLLVVSPSLGQSEYARLTGDTLKYEERTDVAITVETPQGTMDVSAAASSDLTITFVSPDTIRAWYTDLSVSVESPMGAQRPPTGSMIGAEFIVAFESTGEAETLHAPDVPAELRSVSDVQRQFEDFFLILPEEDLRVGYSWPYDISRSSAGDDGSYAFTKKGMLTVTADTVVAGVNALKIEGDLASTMNVSRVDPAQGATVYNEFSGSEYNVFVFSPAKGVLLSRDRTANLSGTTTIDGPMPFDMGQRLRYDSRMRLVP